MVHAESDREDGLVSRSCLTQERESHHEVNVNAIMLGGVRQTPREPDVVARRSLPAFALSRDPRDASLRPAGVQVPQNVR